MKESKGGLSEKYKKDLEFLGKVVRFVRQQNNLSMRDLSLHSGVMPYQISNIENAKAGTRTQTLFKLLDAMETGIEDAIKSFLVFQEGS